MTNIVVICRLFVIGLALGILWIWSTKENRHGTTANILHLSVPDDSQYNGQGAAGHGHRSRVCMKPNAK